MHSTTKLIRHQITAFHDALENLLRTIPVFGDVLDTALEKVLEKTDVPYSLSIYAASYCTLSYEAATSECFLHKSKFFDVTAGLRVPTANTYALGVSASFASMFCLMLVMRKDGPRYRHWAFVSTLVATVVVGFVSSIATLLGCFMYMAFAGNLPESLVSVTIGWYFLAFMWLAFACLTLVLLTILPWKQPRGAKCGDMRRRSCGSDDVAQS